MENKNSKAKPTKDIEEEDWDEDEKMMIEFLKVRLPFKA